MFYKLVSNLPYSPGLLDQVSFYAKRLRREEFVRRTGLVLTAFAVTIQLFAVVTPPQASLAESAHDVIQGGGTPQQILQAWVNNRDKAGHRDIRAIFERFGVGEDQIRWAAAAPVVTIQSRAENNFWSVGRHSANFNGEFSVNVPGANPVYMRPLHAWDSRAYSSYQALKTKNRQGHDVWILLNCGNIVMRGPNVPNNETPRPELPPAKPKLEIRKEVNRTSSVKPGDELTYSLYYRNAGSGPAVHAHIHDTIPSGTTLKSVTPGGNAHKVTRDRAMDFWHRTQDEVIGQSSFWHVVRYTVTVTSAGPVVGDEICNTARIEADGAEATSNQVCNPFKKQTATVTPTPTTPTPTPTTPTPTTPTPTTPTPTPPTPTTPKPEPVPGEPLLVSSKRVSNETRGLDDADRTTARAGDVLTYRLTIENEGDADAEDVTIDAEDLKDVLEYATVEDPGDGIFDNETKLMVWPALDIKAGKSITKTITVKVKNPLPKTPVSRSDKSSYDLKMVNTYGGDTVVIRLPQPAGKRVEAGVSSLPQTGPAANAAIGILVLGTAAYFYARNRLIAKELQLIKREYNHI